MYKGGIYLIISKVHPEKVYVGSSCNLERRFLRHLADLHGHRHANSKLQNHFNKYGCTDLIFQQMILCDRKSLLHLEQNCIDELQPYFNICKKAKSREGVKSNLETRKKLRINSRFKRRIAWYFRPR